MPSLSIHVNGDACWPDLAEKTVVEGSWAGLARLPAGTASPPYGPASSVTARIELPDGTVVLAQTIATKWEALLITAVQAIIPRRKRPRRELSRSAGEAAEPISR